MSTKNIAANKKAEHRKARQFVAMCRNNGWNLKTLARFLGYRNFTAAQQKMKSLELIGQCVQCGKVQIFESVSTYHCPDENHDAPKPIQAVQPAPTYNEPMTGYARRIRANPF